MKLNWVMKAGLAYAGLMAMAACGSTSGGTGGSTGACASDSDCATGEICDEGGNCVADVSCHTDTDCNDGDVCNTTTGICESPAPEGCHADTDCGTGETCDTTTGFCQPASGTTCKQCACEDLLSAGGCANLCDSAQNGNPGTPNFCNGVNALPKCAQCLADSCAAAGAVATDPSGCN
jgi:Cys-rich repeat protein